jgi:integrase
MPNFFKALAEEPSETLRDFMLINLLTGVRKTNVLEMKWQQVSLDRGTWEIPETKNGEAQTMCPSPAKP